MQHELLTVYASQLLEKEHSGCYALLRDDKVWIDYVHTNLILANDVQSVSSNLMTSLLGGWSFKDV